MRDLHSNFLPLPEMNHFLCSSCCLEELSGFSGLLEMIFIYSTPNKPHPLNSLPVLPVEDSR